MENLSFSFGDIKQRSIKNTKKSGGAKGQSYNGFRHFVAKNGNTGFQFSKQLFGDLNLESGGLREGLYDGRVILTVYKNEEHKDVTIFTKSKGDQKSLTFRSSVFAADLEKVGMLTQADPATLAENKPSYTYFNVQKANVGDLPDDVEGVYVVVADEPSIASTASDGGADTSVPADEPQTDASTEAPVAEESEAPVEEAPADNGGSILSNF